MKWNVAVILAMLGIIILITGCTNQPPGLKPVTTAQQTRTFVPVTNTASTTTTLCQICGPVNNTTLPTSFATVVTTLPVQSFPPTSGSGPRPSAQFTASPVLGKVPLAVTFTDLSTGSPDTWNWSFGDGNTSALENPTYLYNTSGTFTVRLVVSNNAGSDSETKSYYIMANPAFYSPGAAWDVTPPTPTQPTTVEFIDRSSGPPTSWDWNFGDGGTSTLQNPVHTYSGPGVYLVSLNVSNEAGQGIASGYVSI
jgi:PKD repeat protein